MKKHLNTLFITTQGTYLAKEGECVVVLVEKKARARIPIHTLNSIVCFGQVSYSPYLLGHCAENNVSLSHLTEYGKFLANMQGPVSGNVLLRREQYRKADDPDACGKITKGLLAGKIANCRTVLQRGARDHGDKGNKDYLRRAADQLTLGMQRLKSVNSVDSLRGIEGDAANTYFGVFNHLITSKDPCFCFSGRNRRPPLDAPNCLLSFIYTLLVHDVRSALECVGLDPAVGYLHKDRPGRPSLALDLMEEFRPFFADRLALTLINRGQITSKGFQVTDSGAVHMSEDARKTLLVAYQNRKQEEVMHPFLREKMTIGMLWHIQARLLARHLRGDLDAYPPFVWK
ncbi:type I-C CRISPR-associated endonuclease Cas1c [Desulfoplanes formicivorans]|uniref:CRISPR-associated endonuclease Cas1 n=1 Tax=Desulfoplanes formicivorans TaxID=1592317 RepID=A0A194AJD3_9BACT|nr:type I-C CRISPR-associated endonuclease Cas1c [Desulfoplanes formicivorans]GAU09433.1 subtype I-C CRISPR-associated endonuclease Cas1 [Desulfoplanes formicivorans]